MVWVFNDVQRTWTKQFADGGRNYEDAKLNLFRGSVDSGCGRASSAMGPFYCPADSEVYIDETFFDELSSRFGAPGDFAQAYVVAHEVGHHVQNLVGTSDEVQRLSRKHPDEANALSIRLELQADCLAGVWARNVYQDDSSGAGWNPATSRRASARRRPWATIASRSRRPVASTRSPGTTAAPSNG